ncbi:mannose-1-phosphate guanylyltransferase [Arcticibacter tournemirensis]|nr:mannose-1-phosphate guanylyltransferase [Arcticibacter tournemirensis]
MINVHTLRLFNKKITLVPHFHYQYHYLYRFINTRNSPHTTHNPMNNYYAVIMAGGVGSRFWPVSRTSYPKQFIDIAGTGTSLIQATYQRFKDIVPEENIYILTNEKYRELVKEQLKGIQYHQVLCEPVMRNTAPCIAYACHKIAALDPEAAIVVAPSDHLILNTSQFTKDVSNALQTASENNCLITLGIQPSRPDTGYGYIRFSDHLLGNGFRKVQQFTEKPDKERAEAFLGSGEYLWNAGIFIWSAAEVLKAFDQHLPEMNSLFEDAKEIYNTPEEAEFLTQNYGQCQNISIDYGIMEQADNVYVLPVEFGWSDLGTWASLYTLAQKDEHENVVVPSGSAILYNSSGCMINLPAGKKIVVKGLKDYIIAESNNTLMIVPRNSEQEVKQVVADVKSTFGEDFA